MPDDRNGRKVPVIVGCVQYELVILHHYSNLIHLYHFQDRTIYLDQLVSSLRHIFESNRLGSLHKSHSGNKFVSLDQDRKNRAEYHKCAFLGSLKSIRTQKLLAIVIIAKEGSRSDADQLTLYRSLSANQIQAGRVSANQRSGA